ncbi:nitroreductase [Thermosporothrix hazakensis]|jgi:nitroreductase|uniref:Nitroreductase n=2 Tax=Thermosporothrix TaxID=768650 RepID=A0A326U6R7_THEHA|nr:nitroreductase family protein [Thermosporothrix hazakensis]PZW29560.1 nitroreductase [Thermosporothrix hazakensis]BBH85847.1 oxidoreductase [Thermosporothrix sp. COM3]GCE45726.1 oxidoreductase [Thermosporothrix hazakensis]
MSGKKAYPFVPYTAHRLSPEAQRDGVRLYLETMTRRRTIREYSSEPVPFELIENAIRAASLAPSGANQQPWTFVVVSDPELKRQLREAAEREEKESYEHRMSREWLEALEPLGTDWHKPHIEQAPYVIVVFAQLYGLETLPDGSQRKVKHYYVQESVGIAVGMLLSALTFAGLATLTHTPNPMGFLGQILKRPANERAYVLIPVGYPAEDAEVPAIGKKPLDQVMVRFDGRR